MSMAHRLSRDGALDLLPTKENAARIVGPVVFNPFIMSRKGAAKVANKHARQGGLGTVLDNSDAQVGGVLEYNTHTPGLSIDVSPTLDGGAGDFSVNLANATL